MHVYLALHVYLIMTHLPPCTFTRPCTFIRHTRVNRSERHLLKEVAWPWLPFSASFIYSLIKFGPKKQKFLWILLERTVCKLQTFEDIWLIDIKCKNRRLKLQAKCDKRIWQRGVLFFVSVCIWQKIELSKQFLEFQSVVFNSGQKMALRAVYVVIC